jgi:hypothetical protein
MTAVHADPAVSLSEHRAYLDYERRLQNCLGTLSRPGWQKRLTPLAEHMARQRLVRARGVRRRLPGAAPRCRRGVGRGVRGGHIDYDPGEGYTVPLIGVAPAPVG